MKTLRLSVLDRLMLPQILPQQGGKIEMLLVSSIAKIVEFTVQEISDFGLHDEGGNVMWTNGAEVDFDFTPEQAEILKAASKRADEEKRITRQNLPLVEKIDTM